jgi:hypothetical protein
MSTGSFCASFRFFGVPYLRPLCCFGDLPHRWRCGLSPRRASDTGAYRQGGASGQGSHRWSNSRQSEHRALLITAENQFTLIGQDH